MSCTYRYPSTENAIKVEQVIWFTSGNSRNPFDLRGDSHYAGRVQYICVNFNCTLRITDLRESDATEYKFRFITNQTGGSYTGSPGVTLRVTGNIYICYISFLQTTNSLCCNLTVIQLNVIVRFRHKTPLGQGQEKIIFVDDKHKSSP